MNQINTWHDCTLSADCRMGIRRASGRRVWVLHPKKSVTHMKEAYVYRRGAKTNKETMNGTLASNLLLGISAKQFHFISLEILYSHNFASFFSDLRFFFISDYITFGCLRVLRICNKHSLRYLCAIKWSVAHHSDSNRWRINYVQFKFDTIFTREHFLLSFRLFLFVSRSYFCIARRKYAKGEWVGGRRRKSWNAKDDTFGIEYVHLSDVMAYSDAFSRRLFNVLFFIVGDGVGACILINLNVLVISIPKLVSIRCERKIQTIHRVIHTWYMQMQWVIYLRK